MIEKKVIKKILLDHKIETFLRKNLPSVPIKEVEIEKTQIGEKLTIHTSLPGLVIGREGKIIKALTLKVKKEFNMENPQIKIGEISNPYSSARIVAKIISTSLSRFGSQRFKKIAFDSLNGILKGGAKGCEIRMTGKLPASRSKSWRFAKGYLKKTGYISDFVMDNAKDFANLPTGTVGIKVSIMHADTVLPDTITYLSEIKVKEEEISLKEKEELIKNEDKTKKTEDKTEEKEVKGDEK